MKKNNDYFSRRLSGLFAVTDHNREDLARHLSVPVKTVQDWERGKKTPDVYQFREIAGFFELPYDWFLNGTDGLPDTEALALRLGLSEGTVELMEKTALRASENALDDLDDIIFLLLSVMDATMNRAQGVKS